MSLHRTCCCGCNSIYRVFKPCDETDEQLYLRRAAVTISALDDEYGEGEWENVVYHYNGQCNCAPYCGTWVCESDVIKTGPGINVCDPVPCDATTSELPCPDCSDETYEDYVYVRPQDIPTRFTEVDDCCETVCDNQSACEGNLIPVGGCSQYGWTHADFTYHPPELTTGAVNWSTSNGITGSTTVLSYQIVDEDEALPTDTAVFSYKSWLVKVVIQNTVDFSGGDVTAWCTNDDDVPVNGTGTNTIYCSFYATPCGVPPEQSNCIGTRVTDGYGSSSKVPFTWNNTGNSFPRGVWEVCGSDAPADTVACSFEPVFSNPNTDVGECARFGEKSTWTTTKRFVHEGGFPLAGVNNDPSFDANTAQTMFEVGITYPPEPSP